MTPTDAPDVDLPPLPPLPFTSLGLCEHEDGATPFGDGYSEDDLRCYAQAYALQAVLAHRQASLDAIAALSTRSRDREERDTIGRCWDAVWRAAAIRGEKK